MDVLKNKSRKSYPYISRYASVPTYYHTLDEKYMYGIAGQLSTNTPYVEVDVHPEDTFDSIANKYYGRPDYYYIIADFNRILDPFIILGQHYIKIKVPALASIEYKE